MTTVFDIFSGLLVRGAFLFLALFPVKFRIELLAVVIRVICACLPQHRRIARINLKLVFPEKEDEWRNQILRASYTELARLLVDFGRLADFSDAWIAEHVDVPELDKLSAIQKRYPGVGMIYAGGHLGSFELLSYAVAHYTPPLTIVMRRFNLPRLNSWWVSRRANPGIEVITRDGAFQEVVDSLRRGRNVGILFDQNVKRNHAVFADFLGTVAATTKTLALAALRTGAPICAITLAYQGSDKYRIKILECEIDHIRNDRHMSVEQKIFEITKVANAAYGRLILEDPAAWFWMHRRWKTTPEYGKNPIYYSSLIGFDKDRLVKGE